MSRTMLLLLLLLLGAAEALAVPPTDFRFFGNYCGNANIEHCVIVRTTFLGWEVDERRVCRTIELRNIRAHLDHVETPQGSLVSGSGTATVDGDRLSFVLASVVLGPGVARGSGTVEGFEPHSASARLLGNGRFLTIRTLGKKITIDKQACGNRPPSATITSPAEGTLAPFGFSQFFAASVSDVEDATFPKARLRWESDRDGPIGTGRFFSTSQLTPGDHSITFSALDSGGLMATDSLHVTVTNEPPNEPVIVQPELGDTIVATGEVFLEGKARDREDGMLDNLRWTSRRNAPVGVNPPQIFHGIGRQVITVFDEPGIHTLSLIAIDSLGRSNTAQRTITVHPFAGNTPPRVAIELPDPLEHAGSGNLIGLFFNPIEFIGSVSDLEDTGELDLLWIASASTLTLESHG